MTYLTSVAGSSSSSAGSTYDSPSLDISGSNKVAWAFVINSDGSPADPTGVVLDPAGANQAFTKLGTGITFATYANCSLWRLIAPSDVTAKIVRATWAASKGEKGIIVWVETGIDQGTPNGTVASANNTTTTVSAGAVSTSVGQRVIQFGHTLDTTPSSRPFDSPTGTERHDLAMAPDNYDVIAAQEQTAGGASTTPTWTIGTGANGWASFAFAVNAADGGSAAELEGAATGQATAAGALSHGVPLAAGATGQATATGAVIHGVPLQGAADAAADATADVSVSGASLIAFRSLSSVPQSGVSSVLFRQPDTLENTDLALWCVVNKYPTNGPGTPTGYTPTAQAVMGDGGAAGADQGDVYATVFHRVCDGTEDAATEAISVTGGNAVYSRSIAFSRSGGTGWNIATASGSQGAASANWNITTGSLDLAAGDTVLVFVAKNSDLDVVGHSAHTLSATGVTFGTFNSRAGPTGTTSGDDVAYQLGEVQVTAGSGSGPVVFTMSATGSAGNSSGGVMLVRLRAATAVDLAGAAVVTGTATGGLSHGVPLQGGAAGVAAASGGLAHGVPLAGAAAGQAAAAAGLTHGVPLQGAAAGQATAAAQIVVQVSEAEMFGRRPRPGRGPYSVGRYFRPRVEAYTPISRADLTGSGAGLSTATGALSVGVTLAGASVAVATAAGAITHGVPLAGSGIAAAAANGSLSIAVALQGSALAQASAGGTLSLQIGLAGGALAQTAATAAMAHGVPLAGAALAAATATGQLDDGGLHGSAAGQASAAGELSLSVPLSAAAVAQAQAAGTLSLVTTLSAAALGQAAAGGALDVAVHLLGAAQGQAIASGSLDADGVVVLAGQAQAEAAAAAGLSIGINLDGDAAVQATGAAALSVLAGLGGAASATATATARLTAPVLMSGRPSNRRPSGGRRPAQLQRGYRP